MMKKIQILKSKVCTFSDGESIDISPDLIYEFKLTKDMILYEKEYIELLEASIRQKAIMYISLKSYTKYELLSKLKQKYTNEQSIKNVLDELEEEKYINDIDYAISYILSRNYSKRKLIMKLMQKGISKENIDIAYDDIPDSKEEELIEKDLEKLIKKGYTNSEIFLKLSRKGYSYQDIKDKIEKGLN